MAAPFIPIATNSRLGAKLRNCVDQFRAAYDAAQDLVGIANQCVNGNDYTVLESQFGITSNGTNGTTSAGYSALFQLQAVVNILTSDSAQSNVKSAFVQFLNQLG
jgi:hypothetical protein